MSRKAWHAAARKLGHLNYDTLLELQGGHCACCPRRPGKNRLHVDHDHQTGEVRGLLCWRCNIALRPYVTSELAAAWAAYLNSPPARPLGLRAGAGETAS